MNGGLGTAKGQTIGANYSVRADLGDVIPLPRFIVTPQLGARVSHVSLRGFKESGSELALAVNDIGHTLTSLIADLDIGLDAQQLGDWTIVPTAAFGYDFALNGPRVDSTGRLYGYTVSQRSADDSRYLITVGLGVSAWHGAFAVKAAVNAALGDRGTGVNGQLSVAYRF